MSKLTRALTAALVLLYWQTLAAAPEWVAHASKAGPDLPSDGASRFDQLFQDSAGHYRIPYPFADLLARLESRVDNGEDSGVRQVFIPIGRSLQRNARAPDYFHFPRAVVALQGEPRAQAGAIAEVLEYRLFIAHQPGSGSLEVISYNDSAGRFEFQVVEGYRAGQQARVRQANRRMCLSCHQNAAPIFATRPWSETNFNVAVAGQLASALPRRFASLIESLSADAGAIDILAEHANYLAAAQLIWREGCASRACRAAALRAVLQYRLSGNSSFARDQAAYRDDYRAELQRNWPLRWPDGLVLGNSRIADRDPFGARPVTRSEDPLGLRPPHAHWPKVDAIVAHGIIFRLAGFLTRADIERIDRHLQQAGSRSGNATQIFESRCRLAHVGTATRLLECSDDQGATGLKAMIELEYDAGEVQSIQLLSLRVPGDPSILQPAVSRLAPRADGLQAELMNPQGGISMRLVTGDRLAGLELHWSDPSLRGENRLRLGLAAEFRLVDDALTALRLDQARANSDSLSAEPFRRNAILADLDRRLGTSLFSDHAHPAAPGNRTTINVTTGNWNEAQPASDLALLQPYCGGCHAGDTLQPPGFLAGADPRQRIRQCAPRILARLLAWQAAGENAITPMPPPATIHAAWAQSDHYHNLVDAVANLVEQKVAAPAVSPDAANYEQLAPCLAPG
jgi:hypothetical protein